jgi:hypothetical protein
LILPQADASCGKTFFPDRRTADGHRIALEVWNKATGRVREGYRLAVYRCKRCCGYHVGHKPIDRIPNPTPPLMPARSEPDEPRPFEESEHEGPRVRRVALSKSAWS